MDFVFTKAWADIVDAFYKILAGDVGFKVNGKSGDTLADTVTLTGGEIADYVIQLDIVDKSGNPLNFPGLIVPLTVTGETSAGGTFTLEPSDTEFNILSGHHEVTVHFGGTWAADDTLAITFAKPASSLVSEIFMLDENSDITYQDPNVTDKTLTLTVEKVA